jgi:heme exporter protein A
MILPYFVIEYVFENMDSQESIPNSTPLVEVKGIKKQFGYRQILKGIDFTLQKGSSTLLLGRNGAGKSTLMQIIAGLSRPTAGDIYFENCNIKQTPVELRKKLGMISHTSHFYGDLTATENLKFYAQLQNIKEIPIKIGEALEKTGLTNFQDLPVKTFSSGMAKRLNIARLMLNAPSLLLLDEPYTGLDYDSIDFFNQFLFQFKEGGGTILIVSHQIETCYQLSDQIMILEQGVIRLHCNSDAFSLSDLIAEYQRPQRSS